MDNLYEIRWRTDQPDMDEDKVMFVRLNKKQKTNVELRLNLLTKARILNYSYVTPVTVHKDLDAFDAAILPEEQAYSAAIEI
jgi:hypothetical protein